MITRLMQPRLTHVGHRTAAYQGVPVCIKHACLAFVQLYARRRHFYPPLRLKQYYDDVVTDVRAESQVCCGLHNELEVAWGRSCLL